jgi:molybdopterin-guanine dinucleotide biosynthesis protein A
VNNVAAFVLAGGKSSRMGRDKAFLPVQGETLLARSLKLATAVTQQVTIVGETGKFAAYGRVVADIVPGCGPLGGIHAALSATSAELNLILAVDLPFLEPRLLEYLIAEARKSESMITVPQAGGRFQPLCAIYRKEFTVVAESALQGGQNKIDLLFAKTNPRIVAEEELKRAGFSSGMFRNLNTPEDVQKALRKIDAAS